MEFFVYLALAQPPKNPKNKQQQQLIKLEIQFEKVVKIVCDFWHEVASL